MVKTYNTIDGKPIYYIYSPSVGQVTCLCRYAPDLDDVASRGEIAIEHDEIMPLEFAQYNEGTGRIEKVVAGRSGNAGAGRLPSDYE